MYGWMAAHLLGEGSGEPILEGDVRPLEEMDARLRCDPEGGIMSHLPTVIQLARQEATDVIAKMPVSTSDKKYTADAQ